MAADSALASVLLLLLPLGGQPETAPPPRESPPIVRQETVLPRESLLGAWQCRGAVAAGVTTPCEVTFAEGLQPGTVFGYFTFLEGATVRTIRRLGRLTSDAVHFPLSAGGEILLQTADHGRLSGRFVGRSTQALPGALTGPIELVRFRP